MKRKLWSVIGLLGVIVIILISILAVTVSSNKKQCAETDSNQIEKIVSDTSLSTADKTQKISVLTKEKKAECEEVKKQIIDALSKMYNENSSVLTDKISKVDALKSFEEYYNSSMKKIDEKTDFGEFMYSIEYAGGSYASVETAQSEYNSVSSFYVELSDLLNELKK